MPLASNTVARIEPNSPRGRERRQKILSAARQLFLQLGFSGTSMDAVLTLAGGSKATLYHYFRNKAALFRAVIDEIVSDGDEIGFRLTDSVRANLLRFAMQRMQVVFSSHHCALLRLLVAESERFPDLAELYYQRGPAHGQRRLAQYLAAVNQNGELMIDDIDEACAVLIGALLHHGYVRQLYLPGPNLADPSIAIWAERVVARFLRCYAPVP